MYAGYTVGSVNIKEKKCCLYFAGWTSDINAQDMCMHE